MRTRWGRQHTHDDGRESRRVRARHRWDEGGGGEVGGELGRCVLGLSFFVLAFFLSFLEAFCVDVTRFDCRFRVVRMLITHCVFCFFIFWVAGRDVASSCGVLQASDSSSGRVRACS